VSNLDLDLSGVDATDKLCADCGGYAVALREGRCTVCLTAGERKPAWHVRLRQRLNELEAMQNHAMKEEKSGNLGKEER